MRHYVLTRSTYAPDTDLTANRRRLELMREVTVRSLVAQTVPFQWIVAVHPGDPLLNERRALVEALGATVIEFATHPVNVPWSNRIGTPTQQLAASAYFADWRSAMEPGERLQTRLDDDDALTADHLERIQHTARDRRGRAILVISSGIASDGRRYRLYRSETTLMATLLTFGGDDLCIYDFGHRRGREVAPIVRASSGERSPLGSVGWLYLRHRGAISPEPTKLDGRLTPEVRSLFPINWGVLR